MKKIFSKENLRGVLQSLTASVIFLILLEPILHVGSNMLSKGGIALIDYFFYSCGHISNWHFINYVAFLCFSYYIMQCMESTLSLYKTNTREKEKKALTSIDQKSSEIESQTEQLNKLITTNKKLRKIEIILKVLSVIFCLIYVLIFCYVIIYELAPTFCKEEFDRKIIQITPYIEKRDIDILKSKWVTMKSKDDYDIISNEINRILVENNLK